ncbi:MAG: hypothetical protein A2Z20_04870 [Bdellovibrionales bacterium RBG_16_40_8]|nr:MAG: hypothetical protein A2Z20_04870 [Bdellovibrionales bacterium RBG_16_40_8]
MLGDRAGGMGGAFTSLTGDPAAGAYYNPATLARLLGSSLSTSVNLFNKYDASYGSYEKLDKAVFRINKGSILTIPAASGIFSSFRSFTGGLSIVMPDYQTFGGDVYRNSNDSTFLRTDDRSLWVGGAFAFNLTERQALGLTVYYTSESTSRSLTNRYEDSGDVIVFNEEKTRSQNSFVYVLGFYQELTAKLRLGTSYRFRSIPVSGEGSFLRSKVGTISGAEPIEQNNKLAADSRIPDKLSLGVSYVDPYKLTLSLDINYYGANRYTDLDKLGDQIIQKEIFNVALGYEKYFAAWLALRLGVFTDLSASPDIPTTPTRRYQDHIDKYGFSTNIGINTTEHTTISIGGYYLGGTGVAAERIGPDFKRVDKTDRLFSFLVGSSYSF